MSTYPPHLGPFMVLHAKWVVARQLVHHDQRLGGLHGVPPCTAEAASVDPFPDPRPALLTSHRWCLDGLGRAIHTTVLTHFV